MIESVTVIGARGRVGAAVAARLAERGVDVRAESDPGAAIVLLCVPDRAIAEVAASVPPGPWLGHVSGATPLAALAPHRRRFSLHPLQSFTHARGPEQLDGAFAAVTADDEDGLALATALAEHLGLMPFRLADDDRGAYHAAAVVAANYLVTLRRAAGRLLATTGAPPQALEPLLRRVMDNGFELTGPIDRGDWETVERNRAAIRACAPELLEAYDALARLTALQAQATAPPLAAHDPVPRGTGFSGTASQSGRDASPAGPRVCRSIAEVRAALVPARAGTIGLVPTMGALHEGHLALVREARASCDTVVVSVFVNPAQFGEPADLNGYPRDLDHDLTLLAGAGVDVVFVPTVEEMYPAGFQTWVEVTELGAILEGASRPGHFRGVATVCLKLFNVVRPDVAVFGQKDAQQVAVLRRLVADLALDLELRVVPTVRDADGLALSSRNVRLTPAERAAALALPRALATRDRDAALRLLADADLEVDYVEVAPFEPPVLAAAVRVGDTRLIDNVPLEEAP